MKEACKVNIINYDTPGGLDDKHLLRRRGHFYSSSLTASALRVGAGIHSWLFRQAPSASAFLFPGHAGERFSCCVHFP